MSEHTPGPWVVVAGDNYTIESEHIPHEYPHRFHSDDTGRFVAYVGNRQADFGQADANLIAAAPELLEACAAAIEQIEALDTVLNQSAHEVIGWHLNGEAEPIASFFEDNDIGAIAKLRAAIAKTKGESE